MRDQTGRGATLDVSVQEAADGNLLLGVVGARDIGRTEELLETKLPEHLRERPGTFEDELNEILSSWLRTRKRREVLARALEVGLHWALVNDMADVAASEQTRARGFLVPHHLDGQEVLVPGRPVEFSGFRWQHVRAPQIV